MQFSLRRLLGWMTLVCLSIGVTLILGPDTSHPLGFIFDFVPAVLRMGAALLLVLAGYAALDPRLGVPSSLQRKWPNSPGELARTGPVTLGLTIVMSIVIGLPGCFMMLLTVEDSWSMDTGGASTAEWIA